MNQWVKVKQQGPSEKLFTEEGNYSAPNPVHKTQKIRSREGIPTGDWETDDYSHSQDCVEDILRLLQEGYEIDYDKNCFTENDNLHRREDTDA